MKKKSKKSKDYVADTVKLGVGSMGGMYAMGAMSNLPGMPPAAKGVATTANVGLGLANIGNLVNITKGITSDIGANCRRQKKRFKYL